MISKRICSEPLTAASLEAHRNEDTRALEAEVWREQRAIAKFIKKECTGFFGGGETPRRIALAVWLAMTRANNRPGYVDSMTLLLKYRQIQDGWNSKESLMPEDDLDSFVQRQAGAGFIWQGEAAALKMLQVSLAAARCLAESNS